MKQLLVFLSLVFLFACNSNKDITSSLKNESKSNFIEKESFGIRTTPILNREYLIYLAWNINVYGSSYPKKIIEILPTQFINKAFYQSDDFEQILLNAKPFFRNYILNPQFIDYPLLGFSTNQIIDMEKWMCDRYNENQLIESGYLNFNMAQKDEDCFVLETLLVDQYYGSRKRDELPKWNTNDYHSNFRLPFQHEIEVLKKDKKYSNKLIPYSFNNRNFLSRWNNHLLDISENQLVINPFAPITIPRDSDFEIGEANFEEAVLQNRMDEFQNLKYLQLDFEKEYPFPEKQYNGQMDFVVVGEDNVRKPLIADKIAIKENKTSQTELYRIAFTKIIESQYLPK